MDLGKNVQQSIDLYLKNFATLFIAGFLASLLSFVTIGILAGPLLGGYIILIKKIKRGEAGDFNEIFAHFDRLLPTFLLGLIMAGIVIAYFILQTILIFIPILGWMVMSLLTIVLAVASPAIAMIYTLAISLIVEKGMELGDAVKSAYQHFMKDPLMNWLCSFIMLALASVLWIVSQPVFAISMALVSEEFDSSNITATGPDITA